MLFCVAATTVVSVAFFTVYSPIMSWRLYVQEPRDECALILLSSVHEMLYTYEKFRSYDWMLWMDGRLD